MTSRKPFRPLLVTGAHRSGTTWVGKMLAAGGQCAYISEPLNVLHRPGVLKLPVEHWYKYICADNGAAYADAFQAPLHLRYNLFAELAAIRSRRDALRLARDLGVYLRGRLLRQRPLLKDPFAVFSAAWFANEFDSQVVITVRHPAAFASSLKRLGWIFDFNDLLAQPLLLRDWLGAYIKEMRSLPAEDVIGQSALLWRMIYEVVAESQARHPEFCVVRHEDLSLAPIEGFAQLYEQMGMPFTKPAEAAIMRSSTSENPKELATKDPYVTRLDSRANLNNWKRRLLDKEIERIWELTHGVAERFYSPEEWN